MGIPAFYRWLVEKYPLTVVDVVEEHPKVVNGVTVPIDTSRPNPNGLEFDNLYLDMNNIIHPCFHPEDQPPPKSFEEIYEAVFRYTDHIFSLVRPRKLLFLAIDGVAPRAKMNQQRARRFRSAKEASNTAVGDEGTMLDSNVITPGTEFMAALSSALQYYIHLRLNSDPGWKNIKVILSDANVPGEGEHKVATYIRSQRNLPGFDPNTRHCLYGLDADLIMIALATHEIHFSILREDVRRPSGSAKHGQNAKVSRGGDTKGLNKETNIGIPKGKFQFLNIWILRDYLEHDLRISNAAMKMDLERLVDDFVFICLFVGNDFLPHIPSLEISEGAIDLLMTVYKKTFTQVGSYLTDTCKVNLELVEQFLEAVGTYEACIFERRNKGQKQRDDKFGSSACRTHAEKKKASVDSLHRVFNTDSNILNATTSDGKMPDNVISYQLSLGEKGWRERYYAAKFGAKTEHDCDNLKRNVVMKYIEGICWVMHYYYEGVCSWQWYYPFHYAPFASDFLDLKHMDIQFTLGVPFKPFDQLLGVLPAASAHALPLFYRNLMTDASSSIADFYPTDFELDMNGKRFAWQAVCKLPFIEESRLLTEIEKVEHTLTDDEEQRNTAALDTLFVHSSNHLASKILSFYRRKKSHPKFHQAKIKRKLDPESSGGMNGWMYISDKTIQSPEIFSPIEDMGTIKNNHAIFVYYKPPANSKHIPRLPDGVVLPSKSINKRHLQRIQVLSHGEKSQRQHSRRPMKQEMSHLRDHENTFLGKRKRGSNDHTFTKTNRRSKYKKKRN